MSAGDDTATPATHQRAVMPATLLITMAAGVFQLFTLALLAAPLIDDIGMSRTELGVLGSINTLVGAATSPYTGRLTDRLGAGRSVVAALWLSGASLAALALSPGLGWMYVAAVLGGIPQGWTNPATNGLIATRVAPGRRGTLTGIKQSGVTFGTFLAGVTLPGLENWLGWRGAVWVFAGLFAIAAIAVRAFLDPDPARALPHDDDDRAGATGPIPTVIVWIAVYAFFMGLASGSIGRFLPLFAEESLGFSTEIAGLIVALGGLLGAAARIGAARVAEHRVEPLRLMMLLSLVGAAFCALLAVTTASTRGLLWLSPPLSAIGTNAWNAVAMLAVIMIVTTSAAGRASGRVMVGFLGGLAASGPVTGWIVDATGEYRWVWVGSTLVSAIAAVLMLFARRAQRAPAASATMDPSA